MAAVLHDLAFSSPPSDMVVSPNNEKKSIDLNKLLAVQQCLWFKELKEPSIDLEID